MTDCRGCAEMVFSSLGRVLSSFCLVAVLFSVGTAHAQPARKKGDEISPQQVLRSITRGKKHLLKEQSTGWFVVVEWSGKS